MRLKRYESVFAVPFAGIPVLAYIVTSPVASRHFLKVEGRQLGREVGAKSPMDQIELGGPIPLDGSDFWESSKKQDRSRLFF